MAFYDIRVENIHHEIISLKEYKGKVLLIVNTATECVFTSQYEGLQWLYEKYQNRGFEVLDFPSNQFRKQAPGSNEEIDEFCIINYKTTFPRFSKINVNGQDESILYTYLKRHEKGIFNRRIKWNFTKFLIDQNGRVIKRYAPFVKPKKIAKDIEKLLERNN